MEHLQLGRVLMFALALAMVVAVAPDQTLSAAPPSLNQILPGCNYTCGDVKIPYPFLEPRFSLTCTNSTLIWGSITVLNISIPAHQVDVLFYVSWYCSSENHTVPWMDTATFSISRKENKFLTVGCDSYGYLNSVYNGNKYSTGCLTRCYGNNLVIDDGICSGIGCCQVDIPPRMRNISIRASNFPNSGRDDISINASIVSNPNCSYSLVVKQDSYHFSKNDLSRFPKTSLPLVLDWTVGFQNCKASKNKVDYACKENSYCDDADSDYGYRCRCNDGYEGNPYLGCTDILECTIGTHNCTSEQYCRETPGSFECFCPEGLIGNGTKEGGGCQPKQRDDAFTKVAIGLGVLIALFMGTSWLYLIYQKRKVLKLKQKFFRQNGGIILKQQLSAREDHSSQSTIIFTAEQLKKATNNFDENLIIGKGGYGIVFKGFLSNNEIVAIKKSKIVDHNQVEQFINEVVVLSQINHRNVVKLLGCCLETEVPLLVYEFVNNGTLFNYLHNEGQAANVCWKTRLRIATEAAEALSYLHSAASIPIIHRDVKTANILLDDTYTAKVSDFGASKLVPLDQTEIATIVQGTFGYLDPEYMQSSQLTEKSDVYSFGVVLVELLTGEKPFSFDRPEEKRSLTIHFLSCLKEDRLFEVLQIGILDEENKQEIMEVAILAAKCLRLRGEERPSMKEVAMELEGIRRMEKHTWTNTSQNFEETQYLLHEASSSIYQPGDSSNHQYTGYESIRDRVLVALSDGR